MATETSFDWKAFFEELNGGSERACAVVGAAILDVSLEELLRAYLVDDDPELANLLHARNDFAPLRDFGSRITCAYLLGAIDRNARDDLRVVKDVRNRFSHSERGLSFRDGEISKKVAKLKIPDMINAASLESIGIPQPEPGPRARFLWTVMTLISYLATRTEILSGVRLNPAPEFAMTFEEETHGRDPSDQPV